MAVTTGTLVFYQSFKAEIGKAINLATDTFKLGLTSSSYTPSASSHSQLSDITNELSGNGYARQTLGSVTWSQSSGTATFDFANPVFTASGGSIVGRYFFIYDDTVANDLLMAYGLLDQSDADVTVTDGNTLTFTVNASGLFTLT